MENQEFKKRIFVSAVWISLFVLIGLLILFIITPPATCTDGKQNQEEKGVDCGGSCQPCKVEIKTVDLEVGETTFADGGNGTFDVIAKITNPNSSMGARSFKYVFILKDANGYELATKEGIGYILPADSKMIAELGLTVNEGAVPVSATVEVSQPAWQQLEGIEKPEIGTYNKKFDKALVGEGSMVEGTIRNESSYDLVTIGVIVALRDQNGKIIAINKTEKSAVRVRESRDFRLVWPYALQGSVQNMDVQVESNVYDRQNFRVVN